MQAGDPTERAAREAAVRQVAEEYLEDPNITSVGVGYRVKGGRRTRELALQFTVDQKFAPETLDAGHDAADPRDDHRQRHPRSATDVVERGFAPHPVAVAAPPKSDRKRRQDPMVPGVSIGQRARVTAGTLGCLVARGRHGRDPHAVELARLPRPRAAARRPGSSQPGPFDDNRVGEQRLRPARAQLPRARRATARSRASRRAVREQTILELGVPCGGSATRSSATAS